MEMVRHVEVISGVFNTVGFYAYCSGNCTQAITYHKNIFIASVLDKIKFVSMLTN
jgi:hypothetical protein